VSIRLNILWRSLASKLVFTVGLTLLASISIWSYFNVKSQEKNVMFNLAAGSDRLNTTIKLGTRYSMMLNTRDEIAEIIKNVSKQPEITSIRIYNKSGRIKYSSNATEIDQATSIKAEACFICHRTDPPRLTLSLAERTRIFNAPSGARRFGILNPIYNDPSCSTADCHVHPDKKKVLGVLEVVVSLDAADRGIAAYKRRTILLAVLVFLLTSIALLGSVLWFVNRPVARLITGTRRIGKGEPFSGVKVRQKDEMGQLARAINKMGREISEKQAELNKQRNKYQNLFELVPCLITVQDRNYKLLNFNREFAEKFAPELGDYCYLAYKRRDRKCDDCPVEKTFKDGLSHHSEETGLNRDGTVSHWLVVTSPIKDESGEVIAAMEINLDITKRKLLEKELKKSEQKYHAIFNNIPNPVFVLNMDTLEILDCNDSVKSVYGYEKEEIINKSFSDFHLQENQAYYAKLLKFSPVINQVKQLDKKGRQIFVNIRISSSEYNSQEVLLVTTSDITKRLEVEQRLSQASKLTTLGEMAAGVAHELNQPLSVIKTVSSFFMRKMNKKEAIDGEILYTMLDKVDHNVDRATKIITHMRLFARKSDVKLVRVQVNDILERAFEIFNQQLKARGIEVVWDTVDNLPLITADPDRLEQVFINLLINARDAIEEKWEGREVRKGDKRIALKTRFKDNTVIAEIRDTGPGIDEAYQNKIFDPFFTTKEVGKGTGLGLSISYGIVKDCGGNIRLARDKGPGACFLLEFPVKEE